MTEPEQSNQSKLLCESLLEDMLAVLPDMIFVVSESGRYLKVIGGGDREHFHDGSYLVGKTIQEVMPASRAEWMLEQIDAALSNCAQLNVEYSLTAEEVGLEEEPGPAGEVWYEARIRPLGKKVDNERVIVWVCSNITERHRLEEQLKALVEYDELTGINNRRKLMRELEERLEEMRRYGTSVALLLLDIDHFKRVNDGYGHLVGDRVLCELSNILATNIREPDLLARFGGEEFAVLMPNTSVQQAEIAAERLRLAVNRHRFNEPDEIRLTISLGLATCRKDDPDITCVLQRADTALYKAKARGRNRWQRAIGEG